MYTSLASLTYMDIRCDFYMSGIVFTDLLFIRAWMYVCKSRRSAYWYRLNDIIARPSLDPYTWKTENKRQNATKVARWTLNCNEQSQSFENHKLMIAVTLLLFCTTIDFGMVLCCITFIQSHNRLPARYLLSRLIPAKLSLRTVFRVGIQFHTSDARIWTYDDMFGFLLATVQAWNCLWRRMKT